MIWYQSHRALSTYSLSSCLRLCVIPELFGEGMTRPEIIKTNAAIISSALAVWSVESPYLHFELIYGAKWLLWSGLIRVCVCMWAGWGEKRAERVPPKNSSQRLRDRLWNATGSQCLDYLNCMVSVCFFFQSRSLSTSIQVNVFV